MIDDEVSWLIDHRCAVAHRGGRPVLCPIQEFGDGALVDIECGMDFSMLQFIQDARHVTLRHTGLHRLLNGEMVAVKLSWPLMLPTLAPLLRRGKWGGVLLHHETYPKAKTLTRQDVKRINLARAYGGANLNGDYYVGADMAVPMRVEHREPDWVAVGHNWVIQQMGLPREMMEPLPPRSECRMQFPAWTNRTR